MTQKKASDYFHKEDSYNCAQAVLKYFQKEYTVSQEIIDSYSAYGGGRAEDGLCGALYAAKFLLDDPRKTELPSTKTASPLVLVAAAASAEAGVSFGASSTSIRSKGLGPLDEALLVGSV